MGGERERVQQPGSETSLVEVPVEYLVPSPYQPRQAPDREDEELKSLAQSITVQGVLQPLLVRPLPERTEPPRYEIVAGERRFRAAQLAGLKAVPCRVWDLSDEEAALAALAENVARKNLSPMETAAALRKLEQRTGATASELAQKVGLSAGHTRQLLRLPNLPPPVQQAIHEGRLPVAKAFALLPLPTEQQLEWARRAEQEGLSSGDVLQRSRPERARPRNSPSSARTTEPPSAAPTGGKGGPPAGPEDEVTNLREQLFAAGVNVGGALEALRAINHGTEEVPLDDWQALEELRNEVVELLELIDVMQLLWDS